ETASGRAFPDDDHTPGRRKGPDRRGLATNRRKRMTKIITWCELRYLTLAELKALFRTLQIDLGRAAPGSPERSIVRASLESVRRAMAARLSRQPKPRARARALGSRPKPPCTEAFLRGSAGRYRWHFPGTAPLAAELHPWLCAVTKDLAGGL